MGFDPLRVGKISPMQDFRRARICSDSISPFSLSLFLLSRPPSDLLSRVPNINQAGKSDEDLDLVSCTVNFEHFGSYFDLGSKEGLEHLNTFVIEMRRGRLPVLWHNCDVAAG